jgi:chromosome segregation ATPase
MATAGVQIFEEDYAKYKKLGGLLEPVQEAKSQLQSISNARTQKRQTQQSLRNEIEMLGKEYLQQTQRRDKEKEDYDRNMKKAITEHMQQGRSTSEELGITFVLNAIAGDLKSFTGTDNENEDRQLQIKIDQSNLSIQMLRRVISLLQEEVALDELWKERLQSFSEIENRTFEFEKLKNELNKLCWAGGKCSTRA